MKRNADNVIFDGRWFGEHGIGRFATEVYLRNNDFKLIDKGVKPTSPLDVLFITLYLLFNKGFYFSPGYNAPYFFLKRAAITIHDLNHIDIDCNSSFLKRLYYTAVMKRACHKAYKIFTVSDFSKKRIAQWAGIDESKIVVVGNGVSSEFTNINTNTTISKNHILVVSNRKEHKNELRIIDAFENSTIPKDIDLVFTGDINDKLKALLVEKNLQKRVRFTGRVTNEELAELYKGAVFLLFPSLYEGFGLPVIEAMSCGTPVITSNSTSLPEVAGDAALLVNPEKVSDITNAIDTLYFDQDLQRILIDKGYIQAKKFTWEKTSNIIRENLIL
ncbi:glycosyltransferase family 4 protein [Shimwellia blattae]|uniref:Putative glycosyl transferase n=1 Tax=Shimwellia blattae (strain ATCC 29907 / DSM 4481 / JCM 1650 / NBRC 105725 / CDC 9005-74) TaxID=630626 RepID=I2B512_SHIBC|nr:glycosyltransferase family 1 protein [Shimwellia blattae]AFJ45616.1 putative glycosyl transferase [Shimwellia blattae DSM 4481 = NBRC 105725]GAB81445.1 putative glycosyltransferase [Shimwellia blattae DSM 4481 = NBRC 105725]VDY63097.1 D-inositol-3-phosphate glycosyltransferase [Shimwellia blattae]VEC20296.1 D-inositol-3-phosphate glycosyltransferase [Shimwellia blattae]